MSKSSSGQASPRKRHRRPPAEERPERRRSPLSAAENSEGPYLTHVRYFHGQQTLVPPENLGRVRKDRSSDRSKRSTRPNASAASSPNRTTSRPVTPSGTTVRGATNNRTTNRVRRTQSASPAHITVECQGDQNQNAIPAEPPPTFEEAMRYNLSSPSSSSIPPSSARESPRPRSEISCSVSNDGSSSGISDGPSSAQVASRHPTILSEWELDLSAGFSLEERVKREWERRHAETIPVPILIPEQVPLSVRHSRQTISANDNINDTPKTDADPNMSDAKAEESDWELVEPVAAGPSLPDSSVVHHPVDATPSRSRRRPPTPPPPLPRSYVSVRDRVRQIEQGNAPSSQGTITNPVKLRRTPPAIPSAKPPKPRGNTSESSTQPRCDSTPRSETLSDEGVITLANIDINTA